MTIFNRCLTKTPSLPVSRRPGCTLPLLITMSFAFASHAFAISDASATGKTARLPIKTSRSGKASAESSPYRLELKDGKDYQLGGEYAPIVSLDGSPTLPANLEDFPFAELVRKAAAEQRIDPALLHAIIHVESRHNPGAVSPKGAIGLMQVLPETARRMGVSDAVKPERNIDAGARYMRFLLDLFDRDIPLALAAYNAGENAVIRYGNQIPPFPETQAYVPAVIEAYRTFRLASRKNGTS